MLLQLLANGLVTGCLYAFVALGFGLIYNTTRVFHFAHGAVYTGTAYVFYSVLILLGWPVWLGIILALIAAAFLGIAIEVLVYYPLYRKGSSLSVAMMSSLGVYIVLVNLIAMLFGNETKILRPGVEKTYTIGPVILTRVQVWELLAFIVVVPLLYVFIKKTNLGKIIRAVRDDPDLITVLGVDLRQVRLFIFSLGSVLAGLAACLLALDVGIDPHIGLAAILMAAVAVIVGGVSIFEGAVVGAFLLGLLQNLAIWKIPARWEDTITFIVLLLFLLLRPEGILGRRRRLEEV